MRIIISGKAFIVFSVALSIMIRLCGHSYSNSHQLIDSKLWLSHTNKTFDFTRQLLPATLEMETSPIDDTICGKGTFLKSEQQYVPDFNYPVTLSITKQGNTSMYSANRKYNTI